MKQGVEVWNKWREENPGLKPDLSTANLKHVNLSNADFNNTNLSFAVLDCANLTGAQFSEAVLLKTVLSDAVLKGAILNKAYLDSAYLHASFLHGAAFYEANLSFADLTNSYLSGADFSHANLQYVTFSYTSFIYTELTSCKGLELTRHIGPSFIDLNSTKLDYANLPVKFLQGCGLHDWQIEAFKLNNPELTSSQITDLVYRIDHLRNSSPIQLSNLFISYSRMDNSFVERLEEEFKKEKSATGVTCTT